MAKPNQIRAARALLGWNQHDLAKIAGISELSVINIEGGKTSPKQETLDRILSAFALSGVVITDDSVEFRESSTLSLSGKDWYMRLMDDMERTSAMTPNAKEKEWIFFHADARRGTPEEVERMKRCHRNGQKMRGFVEEGSPLFLSDLSTYRHVPQEYYIEDSLAICYGDKVAILRQETEPTNAHIFRNTELTGLLRRMADLLWEHLPVPQVPKPTPASTNRKKGKKS